MPFTLTIEVLGRCACTAGLRRIESSSELIFAALLRLALEPRRTMSRTALAEFLWPDATQSQRSGRLRWLLSRLRALDLPISGNTRSISLENISVDLDADRLDTLPLDQIGDPLLGYEPNVSRPFTLWLDEQRSTLRLRVLRALDSRLRLVAPVDSAEASAVAEAMLRIDPLNEQAVLILAETHGRMGSTARGVQLLESFVRELGDDRPDLTLRARVLLRRLDRAGREQSGLDNNVFGRVDELRRIDALLSGARQGLGGAAALIGPAGIGKSRLLDEARRRAELAGMQVVRVSCHRGDETRPLSALAGLVTALRSMRGAAGCDPRHVERLQFISVGDSAVSPPDGDAAGADPAHLRERLGEALGDLLAAVAAELPVLVVVDDGQWMDPSSRLLWKQLAVAAPSTPVALLTAHRVMSNGGEPSDPLVFNIRLGALSSDAAGAMLDELSARGPRTLTDTTRTALLARGAGSPLFLKELARHWQATGESGELPLSLAAVFDASLSTLDRGAVRVLEIAAVLGAYASLHRIERVAQLARSDFVDAVIQLEAAGIMTAGPDGIALGHVLWAEAVLARLPGTAARLIHQYAAELLAEEHRARPSLPLLWEVAHHWESAGDRPHAREAILRGADHLAANGFPDEAAQACARVIAAEIDPRQQLALRRRHLDLLVAAGHTDRVIEEVERHEALAAALDPAHDSHNIIELIGVDARFTQSNDHGPAIASALRCARETAAPSAHRLAAAKLAAKLCDVFAPDTLPELRSIVASIAPRSYQERWDRAFVEMAYHLRFGDLSRFVAVAEEALADARAAAGSLTQVGHALAWLGHAYFLAGRFAEARAALNEAVDIAARLGSADIVWKQQGRLAMLSLDFDPPEATLRLIAEMRATVAVLLRRGRRHTVNGLIEMCEAECAARRGRPVEALELVPALDACLAFGATTWRVRSLAIHLSARRQLKRDDRINEILDGMLDGFSVPDYWHDWPASEFAMAVADRLGPSAAAAFARRYVSSIRRELYPPPRVLLELAGLEEADAPDIVPLRRAASPLPSRLSFGGSVAR